jgi:hypothetical protein
MSQEADPRPRYVTGVSGVVVVVVGAVVVVGGTVVVGGAVVVVGSDVVVVVVVGVFDEFECVTTRATTIAAMAMMMATTITVRLVMAAGSFSSREPGGVPGGEPGPVGGRFSEVTRQT